MKAKIKLESLKLRETQVFKFNSKKIKTEQMFPKSSILPDTYLSDYQSLSMSLKDGVFQASLDSTAIDYQVQLRQLPGEEAGAGGPQLRVQKVSMIVFQKTTYGNGEVNDTI